MRTTTPAILTALLFLPAIAAAQPPTLPAAVDAVTREDFEPRRFDLSVAAGRFVFTDWSDTVVLGSARPGGGIDEVIIRDLGIEPANGFDAALTYWRGRVGFRAHGGYSSSCVGVASECPGLAGVDVDTWLFDIGGSVGLRAADPGHIIRPYVFAGIGAVGYDLDSRIAPDFFTDIDGQPIESGRAVVIADERRQFLLSVDELGLETSLAGSFGVGADFRIPIAGGGLGVRVELADHVSRSPVNLRVTSLGGFRRDRPETQIDFALVHHFRVAAGLVVDFGVR